LKKGSSQSLLISTQLTLASFALAQAARLRSRRARSFLATSRTFVFGKAAAICLIIFRDRSLLSMRIVPDAVSVHAALNQHDDAEALASLAHGEPATK
jgi:hypothetical protein